MTQITLLIIGQALLGLALLLQLVRSGGQLRHLEELIRLLRGRLVILEDNVQTLELQVSADRARRNRERILELTSKSFVRDFTPVHLTVNDSHANIGTQLETFNDHHAHRVH